ncbi:hypothetical protein [Thermoactinomyces sp. CICC 10520]|uniref:hypothetical protein n=1 Tax=Thermoactinomyces sp. CICC 10520 TaxID=2767433 RepID=UPI0018DB915C|nr:hypothetical protein [Thermoactinomyces sp. CICC 10520]MBH8587108.1 hypothetical protein [Thermoactinomyces sp. CICC 10520]
MQINVKEWREMNWGQRYIQVLIAYGYWQGFWEAKRKKPTTGRVVSFRKRAFKN